MMRHFTHHLSKPLFNQFYGEHFVSTKQGLTTDKTTISVNPVTLLLDSGYFYKDMLQI